jgi:hypothetical protein
MRRFTNLGFVLKKKARIYVWLLAGCIPVWAYGLIEGFEQLDSDATLPAELIFTVLFVASLWIVIWRWEAIEQRRIARRVRILLLGMSSLVGFGVLVTFVQWRAGSIQGLYLPFVLSSAPLSAVLAIIRPDGGWAAPLGSVSNPLEANLILVVLFGAPIVWSAMAALATSPHTRRRTRMFMGTILSHYVGAAMVVILMTAGDWKGLNDACHTIPEVLVGWTLVYVAAHILLWRSFLRNRAKRLSPATAAIPAAPGYASLESGRASADIRDDTLNSTRS